MAKVRQQITIEASSRAVWNALTTADGLDGWFGTEARCDARDGGRISVVTGEGDDAVERRGSFHSLKPTRAIEILWDDVGKADDKGTRLQFQIGRDGVETKIHVVQSGGALSEDEDLASTLESRWKDALLRLREMLED